MISCLACILGKVLLELLHLLKIDLLFELLELLKLLELLVLYVLFVLIGRNKRVGKLHGRALLHPLLAT